METGWGLYANKDISTREDILCIARPLVISPDIPRLKDTCYYCLGYDDGMWNHDPDTMFIKAKKLQICTGCHVVRYCSKVSTRSPELYNKTPFQY
jgi:hypothetical protein